MGSYAIAGGGSKNFKGKNMNGYEENLDVSTVAPARSKQSSRTTATKLAYELSYSGLEGTVHAGVTSTSGSAAINGGISIFLCEHRDESGPESAGRHAHVPAVRHGRRVTSTRPT